MEKWYEFSVNGDFAASNQLRVMVPENHWIAIETTFRRGENPGIMLTIDCNTEKRVWINFERVSSVMNIREVEYNSRHMNAMNTHNGLWTHLFIQRRCVR